MFQILHRELHNSNMILILTLHEPFHEVLPHWDWTLLNPYYDFFVARFFLGLPPKDAKPKPLVVLQGDPNSVEGVLTLARSVNIPRTKFVFALPTFNLRLTVNEKNLSDSNSSKVRYAGYSSVPYYFVSNF